MAGLLLPLLPIPTDFAKPSPVTAFLSGIIARGAIRSVAADVGAVFRIPKLATKNVGRAGSPASLRTAVIMVGPGSIDDTLESLQKQTNADWSAVSLPQTSQLTGFQAGQAQAFLWLRT